MLFIGFHLFLVLIILDLTAASTTDGEHKDLRTTVRTLIERQRKTEIEVEILRTLVKEQDTKIGNLKVVAAEQQEKIQSQQQAIYELQNDDTILVKDKRNGPTPKRGNPHLQPMLLSSETYQRLKRQEIPRIAFSAYADHSAHLGKSQTIKFNEVLTNDDNSYNSHTGVFTCPVAGMYLFSFSVAIRGAEQIWAKLVVDNRNELDGAAEGSRGSQDIQGGTTALLHLQTGHSVWIETYEDMSYDIYSNNWGRFNSFSGVLLYTYS